MPIYVKIESKNQGIITQNTGTEEVAGRNSFTTAPAGKDYSPEIPT